MRTNDPDQLDEALILAALEAAINQPFQELLSIAEFVEKADLPAAVEPEEMDDPGEWRVAA